MCGLSQKKAERLFFFEKKKQKTFISAGRISATANKSFLVLFFKKEHS